MKTSNKLFLPLTHFITKSINRERLKKNMIFLGIINLAWLFFRTGSKPSRITYPCQQAAIGNLSVSLSPFFSHSLITSFFSSFKTVLSKSKSIILIFLIAGVVIGGILLKPQSEVVPQEFSLFYESKTTKTLPASDIFIVNGPNAAHFSELVRLMSSNGLFFYQSNTEGEHQNSNGLIAQNDVVLLKINTQWSQRGGTNTDLLREVIQAIVDHPDGFEGEIVIADNGQGLGNLDWRDSNAENHSQSTQDVVDMFSSMYNVSTYNWQDIRGNLVDEYSAGDMVDGYIVNDTPDLETEIHVSYPKFKTEFGTQISFKNGIWNGIGYEKRLKVINMPVLKSHVIYGVTATTKNYMGVQTEILNGGLANGHETVATGGMGTLMVELGLPTLNIIDAIWINANPFPSSFTGPSTSYEKATRVNTLLAGIDPIALDYWAAKHILIETAKLTGFNDTQTLDPDNPQRWGLNEAFGVWLNLTKEEIRRNGLNVTNDEKSMNIFVYEDHSPASSSMSSSPSQVSTNSSMTSSTGPPNQAAGFGIVLLISSLTVMSLLVFKRGRNHNKMK
ncbi:MAG: DUF362 domain-containing protein [Candidatus Thorarchaeota archaeon]